MTLVSKLLRKDKKTSFSYDNLTGTFKDSHLGNKVKEKIIAEFVEKHEIEKTLNETFYGAKQTVF